MVRESVAAGIMMVAKDDNLTSLAGPQSKLVCDLKKQEFMTVIMKLLIPMRSHRGMLRCL